MKIAFLVDHFPKVSETFIINQAIGLLERGHEVDILSLHRPSVGIPVHDEVKESGLLERTHYFPPRNIFLRGLKACHLAVTRLSGYTMRVPRSLRLGGAFQPKNLPKIDFLKKKPPYDLIHCQFGDLGFKGLQLVEMLNAHPRLVVSFRGSDISRDIRATYDGVYQEVFERADLCLANCEFFGQRMLQLGCDANKAVVHRSGLDCYRFPFRIRQPDPKGPLRIVTTGRYMEKKGIEYAICAVARLIYRGLPIIFDIIGDGPLRPHFERLIRDAGIAHTVSLLGYKTQQQIIEILDRSHLFVAPSVTAADGNQDGPTNVLKEAMALGLPVVSTLHGGIPELVQDGISGFLVPERDVDALAERILYLIEHPEDWPSMGQAGRAHVENHYDLQKWNDRLVKVYKRLLNTKSTQSHSALDQIHC